MPPRTTAAWIATLAEYPPDTRHPGVEGRARRRPGDLRRHRPLG